MRTVVTVTTAMAKQGFLTPTRQDYLQGEHEPPTDNAEDTMRSAIRRDTQEVLADLAFLSKNLPSRDRKLIAEGNNVPFEAGPLDYSNFSPSRGRRLNNLSVEPVRSQNQELERSDKMEPEVQSAIIDTLVLLFSLCEHGHVHPQRAVETALEKYYSQLSFDQGDHVAHTKVRSQGSEYSSGRRKLENGEDLKPTEVKALLAEGYEFPEPE